MSETNESVGSGFDSVSDISWVVFNSTANEVIKRDESVTDESQQDHKDEENKDQDSAGISLESASLQSNCDDEIEAVNMFSPTPNHPVDCDLSDGISVISENEGAAVGQLSAPSILPSLSSFSGLIHVGIKRTPSFNRSLFKRKNISSPSFNRSLFKRKNISSIRKRQVLLDSHKDSYVKKTDDTIFTPLRMFLAFLVLAIIPILIAQYLNNMENSARMNDLINRIDIMHKLLIQIKDELNLKKHSTSLEQGSIDNDRNVLLGFTNNIYGKVFGTKENNDGVKSEPKVLSFSDIGRNYWKEVHKHDKHQRDYKNKNNKNQKFEKNYKDTSHRKHNNDKHLKYDKYSNEKIKEKYAKGETNQEFPKDDHHKHFNNNDKKIKDFDYNKKPDHGYGDDKDWYDNMMELREKYRKDKQNKDSFNWFIQRGDERERIRDNDVEHR